MNIPLIIGFIKDRAISSMLEESLEKDELQLTVWSL